MNGSTVIWKYPLNNLFLFLFVPLHRLGVVVDVSGAGGMMSIAGRAIRGGHILGAVVDAGTAPPRRLVSAVNAESGLGGDHLSTFGTSFQSHIFLLIHILTIFGYNEIIPQVNPLVN